MLPGLLWTISLNAPLGLGGYLVARHGLRQPRGVPRALGASVLAWAWMTIGMLVLGNLGLLHRWALLGWSAAGLAIGMVARAVRPAIDGPAKASGEPWDASATLALGLVLWSVLAIGVPSVLMPVKVVSDAPIYHLYFAARWWKEGRLFLVATPFGETAATYFPAGGDLWVAWLMIGWGGDRLARIAQVPFLAMAALATYGLARRLGVGFRSSVVALGWFVTCLPLFLFSFEANVDTVFVAGYLASAYFLLRYALGDAGLDALMLAGLAAGGAWGCKATSTVFVPPLLALGALAAVRRPGGARSKLVHLSALGLATMVMAGYWFGRNVAIGGNPVYPLEVSLFGRVVLPGWYSSAEMALSQFYIPFRDRGALLEVLLVVLDPREVPFWLAALLGVWALGRTPSPIDRWVWLASALAALNVALYWVLIPYRTQQRFMLHAVGLLTIALGRLLDRSAALRWAAVGVLAAHQVTPQAWPFVPPGAPKPWRFSPMVPEVPAALIRLPLTVAGMGRIWDNSAAVAFLVATLTAGLASLGLAWAWGRSARRPSPLRLALAAGATVAVVAVAIATTHWGADTDTAIYPHFRDYYRGWMAVERLSGRDGARIAYAGTNLPYYLMGAGLRNEVRYINVDAHRGWQLHDYHRDALARGIPNLFGPRPGWNRLQPDYDAWLANLRAEHIRYLVVARANPADGPYNLADAERFPIERVWADAHPETFQRVYGGPGSDPLLRVYRLLPTAFAGGSTDSRARSH